MSLFNRGDKSGGAPPQPEKTQNQTRPVHHRRSPKPKPSFSNRPNRRARLRPSRRVPPPSFNHPHPQLQKQEPTCRQ